jgi:hypothetical protein
VVFSFSSTFYSLLFDFLAEGVGSGLRYFGIGRRNASFIVQGVVGQFRKTAALTPVLNYFQLQSAMMMAIDPIEFPKEHTSVAGRDDMITVNPELGVWPATFRNWPARLTLFWKAMSRPIPKTRRPDP